MKIADLSVVQVAGLILIFGSLGLTFWWIARHPEAPKGIFLVCLIAIFVGVALVANDRFTELSIKGVGTIKAATEKVVADAKTVADLKARVENQSATVDLVAQQASAAKAISEQANDQVQRAKEKLDTLDKSINAANAALTDIKSAADFTQTVVAAQNDDRAAFDRLERLGKDPNSAFRERAQSAWSTILDQHSLGIFQSGFKVPWTEGLDPSKLSLTDLKSVYTSAQRELKPALLEYIWGRTDLPVIDRLDFMMQVMKTDTSLAAVEYAGRHFTDGTGQQIKPVLVEYLSVWWNQHRTEFVGK